MKRRIITTLVLLGFAIGFLIFGIHLFNLAMEETDKSIQHFGFFLACSFFIFCAIFIVLMYKYSEQFEKIQDFRKSEGKQFLISSINYLYFLIILTALILDFLMIGIKYFPDNEWYWRMYSGFLALAVAMIVNYVPWFDKLKKIIWGSSWIYLFVIAIMALISLIIIFAL